MIKDPAPNQHYRLSLEKAKRDYKDGILTASGLVYYTIGIYRAPGQKLRVKDIDDFCGHIGINRATFYRAISKLKAKGRLEWEAIGGIDVWIPTSNVVKIQTGQGVSQDCETLSQDCETLSQDCDKDSSKPPPAEDSSPSSNSSQISSKFLSEERERDVDFCLNEIPEIDTPEDTLRDSPLKTLREREKFLIFARSKANQLPVTPQLIEKWIVSNIDWIKQEFDKEHPQEAPTSVKDKGSAAAPADRFFEELPPKVKEGLSSGDISRLDRAYNGLFDSQGNWWKIGDWLDRDESQSATAQTAAIAAKATLRQRFSTVRPGG
ncbi:MAG: hypothetical protein WBC69_21750 [Geitlerinemataceae cyanobacterium]